MASAELNLLVDKLNLQVKSFQEGFEVLSNSKNLTDLARNFSHILRGNLLSINVNIFYKEQSEKDWRALYLHNKEAIKFTYELKPENILKINFLTDNNYKVAITLPMINSSYFGLLIGQKIDKREYSSFDRVSIQIFLQLLDNAYQAYLNNKKEKELIFSLNNRVLQLNSLIDTGIELSALDKTESLLELALERAVVLTNASAGCITVYENDNIIKYLSFPPGIEENDLKESTNKLNTEFSLLGKTYKFILIEKESRAGVIDFDDTDKILLEAFARQLESAIENEHLHKEALEKENIKKELSVASDIQKKIIPEKLPEIDGYDLAGINIPSKEVGGDYYDCIELNDGRYALIMADVAGKGVPAALLVSTLNASLKSYLDLQIPLDKLAQKINSIIYNASPSNKFITFFIAVLNPKNGELDIINAGHNPALLLRNNGVLQKINAGGVALGMFNMGLPFVGEKITLNSADRLLLFTDGIPEAMNENEEEYSDERLEEFIEKYQFPKSSELIDALVHDVKSHTRECPQSDDITALYLIKH
ncbi:MAG: PP2C family protein-serine/threonine phosphatase [Bacteroidetes bacterium]|nr:PP2C family protein-serine/threonine phosphatase [Bacteroidota bacterium]